jgi:hypothetical protein
MSIFKTNKEINLNTFLHRKPDMLFNKIDEEVVMLSIENSEYYGMDKVGSYIWELLAIPISFQGLLCKLMDEYDVSEKQCSQDTLTFLYKLLDKKLIVSD